MTNIINFYILNGKILSFDIGIRNLAYAYIDINDVDDFKIVDWEVIDI